MPVNEPTYVFCDNESVVKNTTNVKSTLNKKHSSVAYHHCRWSVAAGVISITHISIHMRISLIVLRSGCHLVLLRGITCSVTGLTKIWAKTVQYSEYHSCKVCIREGTK
jgi:hypothetical protein